MTTTAQIQGQCDPRFTAVREAFADNFATRGEVGAAVCVYVEGKPVVDLWGGYANAARTRPWDQDTIVSVASTTKGWSPCAPTCWSSVDCSTSMPPWHATGQNLRRRIKPISPSAGS